MDQLLSSPQSKRGRGVCPGHSVPSAIKVAKLSGKATACYGFLRTVKLFSAFCLKLSIKLRSIQMRSG